MNEGLRVQPSSGEFKFDFSFCPNVPQCLLVVFNLIKKDHWFFFHSSVCFATFFSTGSIFWLRFSQKLTVNQQKSKTKTNKQKTKTGQCSLKEKPTSKNCRLMILFSLSHITKYYTLDIQSRFGYGEGHVLKPETAKRNDWNHRNGRNNRNDTTETTGTKRNDRKNNQNETKRPKQNETTETKNDQNKTKWPKRNETAEMTWNTVQYEKNGYLNTAKTMTRGFFFLLPFLRMRFVLISPAPYWLIKLGIACAIQLHFDEHGE